MKSIAVEDNLLISNEQNFTDDIVIVHREYVACAGPTLPNHQ